MNIFAGILAFIGLILSLIVHVEALNGVDVSIYLPPGGISPIWILHLGIFVVMIPMANSDSDYNKNFSFKRMRKILPQWAFLLMIVISSYALVNFMIFMFGDDRSVFISDGKYLMKGAGYPLPEVSESVYHHYMAITFRGFSGHWLVFYSAAFLYYFFRLPEHKNIPNQ